MGNDEGDRDKTTHTQRIAPSDLVVRFLREVDTANAYVIELTDAVARKDRKRCATLKAALHIAWTNARTAMAGLELQSGQREVHARTLLEQSEASARTTLDALWAFVRNGK